MSSTELCLNGRVRAPFGRDEKNLVFSRSEWSDFCRLRAPFRYCSTDTVTVDGYVIRNKHGLQEELPITLLGDALETAVIEQWEAEKAL